MSSDQMSNPSPPRPPADPPARKRNPVERLIVWGLIVALLAVAAREAVARFGYTNSLNSLQAAMEADNDGQTLMVDQVPAHISGSPTRQMDEEGRTLTYHWSGLLKDYGSIEIRYSDDNEVLGLTTADAPAEESVMVPGQDPAELDENGDGFVDLDELAAGRAAWAEEQAKRAESGESTGAPVGADSGETGAAAADARPQAPAADPPAGDTGTATDTAATEDSAAPGQPADEQ